MFKVKTIFSILFKEDENAPLKVLISILEEVSTNLNPFSTKESAVKTGVEDESGSKILFSP